MQQHPGPQRGAEAEGASPEHIVWGNVQRFQTSSSGSSASTSSWNELDTINIGSREVLDAKVQRKMARSGMAANQQEKLPSEPTPSSPPRAGASSGSRGPGAARQEEPQGPVFIIEEESFESCPPDRVAAQVRSAARQKEGVANDEDRVPKKVSVRDLLAQRARDRSEKQAKQLKESDSGNNTPRSSSSGRHQVIVKNTFIELLDEDLEEDRPRRRSYSDSDSGTDQSSGSTQREGEVCQVVAMLQRKHARSETAANQLKAGDAAKQEGVANGEDLVPPLSERKGTWSVGSATHSNDECRPCAWVWKKTGCVNGKDCEFCHACSSEQFKQRRQEKNKMLKAVGVPRARQVKQGPKAEKVETGAKGANMLISL